MEFNIWIMCANNLVASTKMTIFGNFGGIDRSILVHYLQESNFFANWPLLHFFCDFHFEIHFWWLFSHFCWLFKHFSLTFRQLLFIFHELFIDFIAFSVSKEYKWKHSLWQMWVDCCLRTNVCSFINHKLALTKLGGSTFFAPWTIIAGYKCRKGKYWEF